MNIKIVENFVNEKDLKELNNWTFNNHKSSFFTDANMGKPFTRLTTRYCGKEKNFNYPKTAYKIKDKIVEYLNIKEKYLSPPLGKDCIINGIGFKNGKIYPHKDPIWFPNTHTIHCNILSKKCIEGGNLIIEKKTYNLEEGDLIIYEVSELNHSVSLIKGNTPRIVWVFSFSVYKNCLHNIFKNNLLYH